MKSERRHELQENKLAGALGEYIQKIQPYSKTLVGLAAVLAAVIFSGFYFSGQKQKNNEKSWSVYFGARDFADADGLSDVANQYAGTKAAAWALQSAGDIFLSRGTQTMNYDRQGAAGEFIAAKERYQDALAAAQDDMLKQRALFGLAQAHEALEEFDDAVRQYQRVIDGWPDTAIAELAGERLSFISRPSTREFYTWFVKQPPPARNRQQLGNLGLDGSTGDFATDNLSDGPGLQPPERAIDLGTEAASDGVFDDFAGERGAEEPSSDASNSSADSSETSDVEADEPTQSAPTDQEASSSHSETDTSETDTSENEGE